jgi:hypothetical protein
MMMIILTWRCPYACEPRHEDIYRSAFLTLATEGLSGQLQAPTALRPGETSEPNGKENEWAPEQVWTWWSPCGDPNLVVQPVSSHFIDSANNNNNSLDESLVDKEQSYWQLKFGDIRGITESTTVSAQDQAISTNYFKRKILKEETESRCRLCK